VGEWREEGFKVVVDNHEGDGHTNE
jgi:hypothetical protein